jgi:aspartyl-tRNA(Asn)/glutamyl-tRNA(Gln) amidotransferase subunit B
VCSGYPGVLPVANKQALDWAIKVALALDAKINRPFRFDRKHYFYPDLPKNYQISQYQLPIAIGGKLELRNENGEMSEIRITRVHLEEDAGKLIHPQGQDHSLVDFNRAGTPLLEIVTEPDIHSSQDAKIFMRELRLLLRYLEVSDADMEKGHLRCDANISITENQNQNSKFENLGTPVEIKNMNSFKAVERALAYEEKRLRQMIKDGEEIHKETRGWIEAKGETVSQRSKEFAHDYRYFPEPDLPPFEYSQEELDKIKSAISEQPESLKDRFQKDYGLKESEAKEIAAKRFGKYFEEATKAGANPHLTYDWMINERLGDKISLENFVEFIKMLESKKISGAIGREIVKEMQSSGKSPSAIIQSKGLKFISSEQDLEKIIEKVLVKNSKAFEDFKNGKAEALGFLVGQVMRETKGQAEPQIVTKIIESKK